MHTNLRHRLLTACLLITGLALCNQGYAEVYKTIDEHGNPQFSDQPQPDAQPVEIKQTNTVKPVTVAPVRPSTKPQKPDAIYRNFAITSPRDGSHIGNGLAPFNVSLSVQPKLLQGHKIQLFINGQLHSAGRGLSRQVASIERGEHSLSATIVDQKGNVLISSAPVNLTAQRPSLLNPGRNSRSAP